MIKSTQGIREFKIVKIAYQGRVEFWLLTAGAHPKAGLGRNGHGSILLVKLHINIETKAF